MDNVALLNFKSALFTLILLQMHECKFITKEQESNDIAQKKQKLYKTDASEIEALLKLYLDPTVNAINGGCSQDVPPCNPPNGFCTDLQDPYGQGYMCLCWAGNGGSQCQHVNACEKNPCMDPALPECYATAAEDKYGRLCFPLQLTAERFMKIIKH